MVDITPDTPRKRGRPTKKKLATTGKGAHGKRVGRPPGDAAIINEYKQRMLASPKSQAVLDKVFAVALDDDHKSQSACMKLVMDRIAPLSFFEKDKASQGISGVSITINNVSAADVAIDGDIVDEQ